ncbi:MAG: hypothetical protein ACLPX8_07420, partial [Bryobacteraceae bacterium]
MKHEPATTRRWALWRKLHDRIDAQRGELDIAARMVLGLGGQPAHLHDLPWVPAGALQHLSPELIEVQLAQSEMVGGGFEQLIGVAPVQRRD